MSLSIIERCFLACLRLKEVSTKKCEKHVSKSLITKCINIRPKTELSVTASLQCLLYDKRSSYHKPAKCNIRY